MSAFLTCAALVIFIVGIVSTVRGSNKYGRTHIFSTHIILSAVCFFIAIAFLPEYEAAEQVHANPVSSASGDIDQLPDLNAAELAELNSEIVQQFTSFYEELVNGFQSHARINDPAGFAIWRFAWLRRMEPYSNNLREIRSKHRGQFLSLDSPIQSLIDLELASLSLNWRPGENPTDKIEAFNARIAPTLVKIKAAAN